MDKAKPNQLLTAATKGDVGKIRQLLASAASIHTLRLAKRKWWHPSIAFAPSSLQIAGPAPRDSINYVNELETEENLNAVRRAVAREASFGQDG